MSVRKNASNVYAKKFIVEMNLEKGATGPCCAWGGSLVLGLAAPLKIKKILRQSIKKLTCQL